MCFTGPAEIVGNVKSSLPDIKNKRDCLALYESLMAAHEHTVAVNLVAKALIASVNRTPIEGSHKATALAAYTKAHDIFAAFSKMLYEKNQVFVSRYHLMAYLKMTYPIVFNFLRTSGLKPAREYEAWEKGGDMK